MKILLGSLILLAIVIFAIAFFAIAMRALLHDPKRHRSAGTLSSAMLEVQSLLEPSKKHAVESVREREDEESDDSGAPPSDLNGTDRPREEEIKMSIGRGARPSR